MKNNLFLMFSKAWKQIKFFDRKSLPIDHDSLADFLYNY